MALTETRQAPTRSLATKVDALRQLPFHLDSRAMDICGELVKLRAPLPEDAPFIADIVSIPEVARTLDAWAHGPYSVQHALDWVNRHDPGQVNWAIECLAYGAFLGATGLRDLDFRD